MRHAPKLGAMRLPASPECVEIQLGERSYPILIGSGLLGDPKNLAPLPAAATALIVTNTTVAPLYARRVAPDAGRPLPCRARARAAGRRGAQGLADAEPDLRCAAGPRLRPQDGAVRARRRRGGRHDRLRRSELHARRPLRAGADHAARAGRLVGRRQDRDQPSARQEHDRRVLPAAAGAVRPGHARARCRRANSAPAWPRSSSTARSPTCAFLDWIEANIDALVARESRPRWRMPSSAAARSRPAVVGQDEREAGLRAILNFGHTFGHAIEAGLGYGKWLHGEAVGCGMVMAAHLSQRLGRCRRRVRRAAHAPDRARRPAGGRPGARRRALSGADAGRQEGRRPARSASS